MNPPLDLERAPVRSATELPSGLADRDLLRGLLDSALDSVYFKDLDSRFLRISRSLADRLGLASPEEAVGKTDADFFHPAHASQALADERRVIATGEPVVARMEREVLRDGRERWVMSSKMPFLDSAGRICGTLGISRDVTALKQAEDELAVARDAALESARLKSEFLANMSHEIRTPLNAVIGMAGLLLDTALDADQRDLATTVRSSADVLLGIVNDVLDFSKIEAGKMTIEHIDYDVTSVVEEAADLVAEQAHGKGLELATSVSPQMPAAVRGDPSRVRQVLVNLLSNAVKFTETGEVVASVDVVGEGRAARLRWQVRDTGIGVSETARGRLFRAFSQADGSTTRRYGGTGLGLAICKRLVTLMDGEIGFDSIPGEGTTFWFTLPLEASQGARPVPVLGSLEGVRVLIVDDNATNREILHRQVGSWRMRHQSVSSGPDALEALTRAAREGDPFALVVLDVQMPDMDGIAVARAITANPVLADTSIAVLTSLACHPAETDLRAIGVSAYLTKPVKQSKLYDCLASALGARAAKVPPPAAQDDRPSAVGGWVGAAGLAASWTPTGLSKPARVLVAEDNAVNQKVALRFLQKLGIAAEAVGTGREALAAVTHVAYDVILMDCQMPELDGYEATRRLREWESLQGGRRHYIVALTAHALDGDRQACLDAGMDDYVSKPIALDRLVAALARASAAREGQAATP